MRLDDIALEFPRLRNADVRGMAVRYPKDGLPYDATGPQPGDKVYVQSTWMAGIWFAKERNQTHGRIWPYTGAVPAHALTLHPDFFKEYNVKKPAPVRRKRERCQV
jgi:hypothetical protein